jgi:hypothetical protein
MYAWKLMSFQKKKGGASLGVKNHWQKGQYLEILFLRILIKTKTTRFTIILYKNDLKKDNRKKAKQ